MVEPRGKDCKAGLEQRKQGWRWELGGRWGVSRGQSPDQHVGMGGDGSWPSLWENLPSATTAPHTAAWL